MKKRKSKILKSILLEKRVEKLKQIRSLLHLLKLDAQNLYDRIHSRQSEYMLEFSMKRTRDHFKEIFYHRYGSCKLETLNLCSVDIIISLDKYYKKVDDLLWYLNHTQDMIKTAEDRVSNQGKILFKILQTVELYIDAEIEVYNDKISSLEKLIDSSMSCNSESINIDNSNQQPENDICFEEAESKNIEFSINDNSNDFLNFERPEEKVRKDE